MVDYRKIPFPQRNRGYLSQNLNYSFSQQGRTDTFIQEALASKQIIEQILLGNNRISYECILLQHHVLLYALPQHLIKSVRT